MWLPTEKKLLLYLCDVFEKKLMVIPFLPQRYRNLYTTSYFLTLIQYIVYIMSIFIFLFSCREISYFAKFNVNKIRNMKKLRFLILSIVLFITLGVMGEEGVLLQLRMVQLLVSPFLINLQC